MRLSPLRRGLFAVALGTTMTGAGAVPALAQDETRARPHRRRRSIAKVGVGKRKINVRAGRRAVVAGTVLPRARRPDRVPADPQEQPLVHDRPRPHGRAGPLPAARQAPRAR